MSGSLTSRMDTVERRLELALHDLTELRKQLTNPLVVDTRGLPARWRLSQREAQVLQLYMAQEFVTPAVLRQVLWPVKDTEPFHVGGVINTIRNAIKRKLTTAGLPMEFAYVRGYGTRIPLAIKTEILKEVQAHRR